MPIRINNVESNVRVAGDGVSGEVSASEVERIVRIVMERLKDEREHMDRINEETRITNKVSKQDLFD